jgi:sugar/nucleoside kinase (ribokinase family)
VLGDLHVGREDNVPFMRTLCLGEALVDLICEQPVAGLAEAPSFVPHFGGATANVAVHAARTGAHIALGGGVGNDAWGRFLRERLVAENVELDWFSLLDGVRTPIATVAVDANGEPDFDIFGEDLATLERGLGKRGIDRAMAACDGLFFGSNTLVGEHERQLTMRARERALEGGKAVLFDANLRLERWRTAAEAASYANECVPDAFLVRANAKEVQVMTGEPDPEAGARALLKAGARNVVITLGAAGAMLRGELRADVPGVAAQVISTVGAGDALMGTLLGRATLTGFYSASLAASLGEAVAASARATERWGAL